MAPRTPDRTAPDTNATPGPGEKSDELWLALRALPAGQRRVVVLRNYRGLSIAETANDLGVDIGTVKSQTSAALASLRRILDPTLLWPASRAVLRKPSEGTTTRAHVDGERVSIEEPLTATALIISRVSIRTSR